MFFGVAAIIGMIACKNILFRIIACATWLCSSLWGLIIAIEHRGFEIAHNDPFGPTCGFRAEFPAWFKLDEWLPSVFAPTGICGDAIWNFAGLTMVQWIIIIYVCNLVVASVFLLLSLIPLKKYNKMLNPSE
jgi:protein dithiol:quinone oxidoreductase